MISLRASVANRNTSSSVAGSVSTSGSTRIDVGAASLVTTGLAVAYQNTTATATNRRIAAARIFLRLISRNLEIVAGGRLGFRLAGGDARPHGPSDAFADFQNAFLTVLDPVDRDDDLALQAFAVKRLSHRVDTVLDSIERMYCKSAASESWLATAVARPRCLAALAL